MLIMTLNNKDLSSIAFKLIKYDTKQTVNNLLLKISTRSLSIEMMTAMIRFLDPYDLEEIRRELQIKF